MFTIVYERFVKPIYINQSEMFIILRTVDSSFILVNIKIFWQLIKVGLDTLAIVDVSYKTSFVTGMLFKTKS